jgi:hypothetical protein
MSHKDTMSLFNTDCNEFNHFVHNSLNFVFSVSFIQNNLNSEDKTALNRKKIINDKKNCQIEMGWHVYC